MVNATHCIECGGASDASHNCGAQDEAHSYLSAGPKEVGPEPDETERNCDGDAR